MLEANLNYKSNNQFWIFGLVTLWVVGWLAACASMPSQSPEVNRTCDAWADEAVALEQWPEAVKRHEQVLRVDPSNCLAIYHLGYIWGQMDDHSKEVHWYKQAIACGHDQNDTLYFNMGMAHIDLGQLELAHNAFKRAVALNPDKADNHFGCGVAAHAGGNAEAAERALKQALSVSAHHWEARILLVKTYLDQGRLSLAESHLAFMIERIPHNPEVDHLYKRYRKRRITTYD